MYIYVCVYIYVGLNPTYLPTCPPAYLPTYLPTYPPAHLPTNLPTYPPTHLPTYPPTYLHTYFVQAGARPVDLSAVGSRDELMGAVLSHSSFPLVRPVDPSEVSIARVNPRLFTCSPGILV